MAVPTTCCGRSGGDSCACAQKATCSCGKQSALNCNCEKASTENAVAGARCSCRARPAGACTCDRAGSENTAVTGSSCACGKRSAGLSYQLLTSWSMLILSQTRAPAKRLLTVVCSLLRPTSLPRRLVPRHICLAEDDAHVMMKAAFRVWRTGMG